jgi:hypothetical protein
MIVSSRQQRTLEAIFADPPAASLRWSEIESLLRALGAECSEGSGSRLRVALNDVRAVFHRPHPEKEASRSTVRSGRRFLEQAGVSP